MKLGHKLEQPKEVSPAREKNPTMYPSLYLSEKESKAIPTDLLPGDTFEAECVFKVTRVSVNTNEQSGERRSVDLDVLELTPEVMEDNSEKEKKALGYDRSKDPNTNRDKREKMKTPKAKDLQ